MKKFLFLALAAILLAGCSNESEELKVKNEEFAGAVYDLIGRRVSNSQFSTLNSQLFVTCRAPPQISDLREG